MNDLAPKDFYELSQLKDWAVYEGNLQGSGWYYIRKYCTGLFQKWVRLLPNPFVIDWLENTFLNNGHWALQFDQLFLGKHQEWLGEPLFRDILQELEDRNYADPFKLKQEIESFRGELLAAGGLIRLGKTPRKIKTTGDFSTGHEVYSVKTALGMDFNYETFQALLRSQRCLSKNGILKKYNEVFLRNQKSMNDHFRSDVAEYLENKLARDFEQFDGLLESRDTISKVERFEDLEIYIVAYKNKTNHIELTFRDLCIGGNGHLEILFEENFEFPRTYSAHEDTDTWWVTPLESNNKFKNDLTEKIQAKVEKLKDNYRNHQKSNLEKRFIGWINIGTHVQHDDYKKNVEEMRRFLENAVGYQLFDIYVYFGFDYWEYSDDRLFFFQSTNIKP